MPGLTAVITDAQVHNDYAGAGVCLQCAQDADQQMQQGLLGLSVPMVWVGDYHHATGCGDTPTPTDCVGPGESCSWAGCVGPLITGTAGCDSCTDGTTLRPACGVNPLLPSMPCAGGVVCYSRIAAHLRITIASVHEQVSGGPCYATFRYELAMGLNWWRCAPTWNNFYDAAAEPGIPTFAARQVTVGPFVSAQQVALAMWLYARGNYVTETTPTVGVAYTVSLS